MAPPLQRRRIATLLAICIALAGVLGCEPPPNMQQQAQRPPLRPGRPAGMATGNGSQAPAEFEIHLDRSAMATHRVDAGAVTEALSRFFEAYPYFSLSDLQDMKVRGTDGREVALRQVATVDVWFAPAKTELVVGAGK